MLIFTNNNKHYIFIHIPKNSGKYFREKIKSDTNNKIIKSYWGEFHNEDLAHIPYIKRNKFIDLNINYNYFTYSRCPYDRIISAFFYKNNRSNINDFKNFIKKTLSLYNFSMDFNSTIIHYYPQYLFVCNEELTIPQNIKIDKIDAPKKYILKDYFDDVCIHIINNIYNKDFIYFNYQMIDNI